MATTRDLLSGARQPKWTFTLLNELEQPLRDLLTVKSWSFELNMHARLWGSGNLELLTDRGIDFQKHRLRVTYNPGVDGVDPWNVGVFLFAEPGVEREDTHSVSRVKLIGKLAIPDEDSTVQSYSVAKGRNLVKEAETLLRSVGETRLRVVDSELVAREPLQFKAGESLLTVINELLEAAGYWSLGVDGGGTYTIEPYRLPAERPILWEFQRGVRAVHVPSWTRDQDVSSVPNRIVCRTTGTDEEPALVGVAENEDASSPFSFQARGRWVTKVYDVEAANQAEINKLAQRHLVQDGNPVASIVIEHAPVPIFPRQAVRFVSEGISTVATVARMSVSSPGYLVRTELKEARGDYDKGLD